MWFVHYPFWITDGVVELLDLKAASVANPELGKWEGAKSTIAVEPECVFQIGPAGVGWPSFLVGDGDFFSGLDVANRMDGLALCVIVPAIVSIWQTAVIDETNGGVHPPYHRVRATGQSVCSENTAECMLAGEVVVQGEEHSLLALWQ